MRSSYVDSVVRQYETKGKNLYTLLNDPICITTRSYLDEFDDQKVLRLHAIESLPSINNGVHKSTLSSPPPHTDDIAMLMLTSGSTGNSNIVGLRDGQIISAVAGKACMRELPPDYTFLSWIVRDHVANMLEIHLQAVYLGMEKILVRATDVIANPPLFLRLIDRHRVCRSFAPNFFLARLRLTLEAEQKDPTHFDLSCLRCITSGEGAVETAYTISKILSAYGAPSNVLAPGFSMTETYASSIFNRDCPQHD